MRFVLDPLSPTGVSPAPAKNSFTPYFAGGPGKPSLVDSVNGKHGAVVLGLDDLDDVVITGTPSDNQAIAFDTASGKFIPQSISGSGSGVVETIVPGNNIDVDSTDPANPIVAVETLTTADISDITATATELNVLDGIPAGLTATELGYVDGVTSAIQTQLNAKAADADVVHDTGAETIAGVKTFSSDPIIPDEAYGVGWNGSLEPPTKNAVYDKIETIGGGASEEFVIAMATAL